MPEKTIASNTASPIVTALNVPRPLSWSSVLGRLKKKQMAALTALNAIVHAAEFERVLSNLAPTRQCNAVLNR
jgi:hypothetical protein